MYGVEVLRWRVNVNNRNEIGSYSLIFCQPYCIFGVIAKTPDWSRKPLTRLSLRYTSKTTSSPALLPSSNPTDLRNGHRKPALLAHARRRAQQAYSTKPRKHAQQRRQVLQPSPLCINIVVAHQSSLPIALQSFPLPTNRRLLSSSQTQPKPKNSSPKHPSLTSNNNLHNPKFNTSKQRRHLRHNKLAKPKSLGIQSYGRSLSSS